MQPSERQRTVQSAQAVVRRVGMQLIAERKAAIKAELQGEGKDATSGFKGRDLLTLLIKANMSEDVPENQRLTDDEVLARMSPFCLFPPYNR